MFGSYKPREEKRIGLRGPVRFVVVCVRACVARVCLEGVAQAEEEHRGAEGACGEGYGLCGAAQEAAKVV